MYSFYHIYGIMGHIFQTCSELWVQILNKNGTSPLFKARLSYPQGRKLANRFGGGNEKDFCPAKLSGALQTSKQKLFYRLPVKALPMYIGYKRRPCLHNHNDAESDILI